MRMQPNTGIVSVPDDRLQTLATLSKTAASNIVPTAVEYVDIAGLVKCATSITFDVHVFGTAGMHGLTAPVDRGQPMYWLALIVSSTAGAPVKERVLETSSLQTFESAIVLSRCALRRPLLHAVSHL